MGKGLGKAVVLALLSPPNHYLPFSSLFLPCFIPLPPVCSSYFFHSLPSSLYVELCYRSSFVLSSVVWGHSHGVGVAFNIPSPLIQAILQNLSEMTTRLTLFRTPQYVQCTRQAATVGRHEKTGVFSLDNWMLMPRDKMLACQSQAIFPAIRPIAVSKEDVNFFTNSLGWSYLWRKLSGNEPMTKTLILFYVI